VFISQPPGSAPPIDGHSYNYDGTSGSNVVVYVLDVEAFDFSLPVSTVVCFHVLTDGVCANKQKELSLNHPGVRTAAFGQPGWVPGYDKDIPQFAHGTAMAAALGGDVAGVAKGVTFVPVAWQIEPIRWWVIDALDWILSDWRKRVANSDRTLPPLNPTLAPLGVLSMSFGTDIDPDPTAPPAEYELTMSRKLRDLVDAGILPVASAGNDGVSKFSYRILRRYSESP
jgi:hypothetical protein